MLIILPAYLIHAFLGLCGCQTKILFCTLVGCEPENEELKNQHWTSSNPHRLWQCIKEIKPFWHARLSEERYKEKDFAWQFIQLALWIWDWISFTMLESRSKTKCLCHEYRQPLACQWKACSRRFSASEMITFYRNTKKNTQMSLSCRAYYRIELKCQTVIVQISYIVNFPVSHVENCL